MLTCGQAIDNLLGAQNVPREDFSAVAVVSVDAAETVRGVRECVSLQAAVQGMGRLWLG